MQSVNQKSIEQGGDYSKLFHCNAGQCNKVSLSRPILNKLNAEGASNHLSPKFDNNKEKIIGMNKRNTNIKCNNNMEALMSEDGGTLLHIMIAA